MKKSMKNIVIDVNPLVHGSRAIRRCLACMVSELINHNEDNYNLLSFSNKNKTKKYLAEFLFDAQEKVVPIPYRLLVPFWKYFSWPKIETIIPECDILYTNEFYFPPTKNALVLATIHGLAYRIIPDKINPQIVQSLNQDLSFAIKHADYLIAVSETTKKELITQVGIPPNRIYVVTHGVDKQFRKIENLPDVWDRLKKNYALNRPYILYVGAIGMHKNIMGILSAYQKTFDKISHDLVLAGPPDSAWESAKRFVNDFGLSENVHFLGHVNKTDDLSDIYNGADLFVFPSFYEGWTSPPLEAMACGTPVITSNCSSLPETVGNAAILIDPNDSEALAQEMKRVLSNKELQIELIEKGLVHVASHTWENVAQKVVEVFADVMARGPWDKR
jgi:glycosyltransferase involved in cell wall biosynthesis